MHIWTSVVLELNVASFGRIGLRGFAQLVGRNAGVDEQDKMDDPEGIFRQRFHHPSVPTRGPSSIKTGETPYKMNARNTLAAISIRPSV